MSSASIYWMRGGVFLAFFNFEMFPHICLQEIWKALDQSVVVFMLMHFFLLLLLDNVL